MKDLIKIAEKQIEKLEEVQGIKAINTVEVSEEIRKWCEFIQSLYINENYKVCKEKDYKNWWKQENGLDRLANQLYAHMNFSNIVLDNIATEKLVE